MKRHKISTAALALLLAAWTGCSDPSSPSTSHTPESSSEPAASQRNAAANDADLYTPAGEFPIVAKRISLTFFAPADGDLSRDENDLTKELEERSNIDIVWQIASNGAFQEKLKLMFASGEPADVVATGPSAGNCISRAEEQNLGAQGLIIPLENLLDTLSQGYQEAFEQLPGLREYITTPEGHIYTLPNVDGSLHIQFNNKLWLNVRWLDALKLEMPATTEELYEVLLAFRDGDPNGNGDTEDEIPLSTCKTGTGVEIDGFLMNPFQLTPESKLYLEGGKVIFSPSTEGYREGLRYLRRLYEQGLITPDAFTQDMAAQVKRNEGGDVPVIGSFLAQRPGYACDLTVYPDNSRIWEQYRSVPPLTGPDGTARSAWNPYAMYQTGVLAITSACAYPEAAFRLVDWLATEEGTLRTMEGPEGIGWRYAEEGELGLGGEQALITQLPDTNPENSGWGQLCGVVRSPELAAGYTAPQDPYGEDVRPLVGRNMVLYQASLEHQQAAQPFESVLPELFYPQEQAERFSVLKATVAKYTAQSVEAFVTGTRSLDRDWDTYLRQLEAIGLSEYLEMVQQAYDSSAFGR